MPILSVSLKRKIDLVRIKEKTARTDNEFWPPAATFACIELAV